MKKLLAPMLAILAGLLIAACGGEETTTPPATTSTAVEADGGAGEPQSGAGEPQSGAGEPQGTTVVIGESRFGQMVFDENDQAVYVFERDEPGKSNCYGECAEAWPPVLTSGEPVAGDGVDSRLLGTTKRDDGSEQVTYDGRPLYFYAHESPGEVRCHNVDLNGGLWWVVGPDGEPLA